MVEEFKEISEKYSIAEAIKEAQRCLQCKVPGCKKGCPISNDIPLWIEELSKGNFGNAMEIINTRSNLPAVCGRVCAHERVHKLVDILRRLSEGGNTVIVIEHNLDVIKSADYLIDMGPEGGENGGRIIAQGTPEEVARTSSPTSSFLREELPKKN